MSNVLSGVPVTYKPFITQAKYAAEYRNYWWTNVRQTKTDTGIAIPEGIKPYPAKSDHVADRPVSDSGGNFGRLARIGIMDAYISELLDLPLAGIPAKGWIGFLKQFEQ